MLNNLQLSPEVMAAITALAGAVAWITRAYVQDLKEQVQFYRASLLPAVTALTASIEALKVELENLKVEKQRSQAEFAQLQDEVRHQHRDRE